MKVRQRPSVLRVLHVGVGNRGTWPLELCTPETGFVPAALCDVRESALREARERTGLPASVCFENYTEALAHTGPNIDCIIICAPTIFPARSGSSPPYSKLRPLRGSRIRFTPPASSTLKP